MSELPASVVLLEKPGLAISETTGARSIGTFNSGGVNVRLSRTRKIFSSLVSVSATTALRSGSVTYKIRSGTQLKIMPARVTIAVAAVAGVGIAIGVIVAGGAKPSSANSV